MLKKLIFTLFVSISLAYAKDICHGDLGCFTDSFPFSGTIQRPFALLPETPEKIGTKFTLFNRKQTAGQVVTASNLGNSFDASLPTKFIIHGFLHNANKQWVIDMKNALIFRDDVNVITVDWSKGNGFPYTQATANTQIVGAEIAKLIKAYISSNGANAKDFHVIGHSLGSHIAGYAGARVPGMGRITGLDPAGPYFENTDPVVRLDPTDALFVEAIHTDGTANLKIGLGLIQPVAHADFYPNGGKDQPSCPETPGKILSAIFNLVTLNVDGLEDGLGCSHMAATTFYTESILSDSCKFTAYKCSSEADFNAGKCISCSGAGCNRMGYGSSPSKELGTLYLNTQTPTHLPLCKQNYLLTLYSNSLNNIQQARGRFTIIFKTAQETSQVYLFDDSDLTYKQGSIETKFISLNDPLRNSVESVFISYRKTTNFLSSWMYDAQWSFKYVEVKSGDAQTTTKFCPVTTIIDSGETVEFKKC